MSDRFELALDECIRLMLQGMPAGVCLARHPEHAAELAPQLAVIERMAASFGREPGAAASARSRQRLQDEMASLQRQDLEPARRASWVERLAGWMTTGTRRWATAAAAIALILVAGAGAVAASAHALPGELLYPVKRASEQARLAAAFSDRARAELHLAYAERRVDETSTLVERGDMGQTPANAARLEHHLAAASHLAAGTEDKSAQAFQVKLSASAAVSLTRLEQAVARAPEAQRAEASALVFAAGASYAGASETLAARTEPLHVAGEPGQVQIRVVDQPPPGVQGVIVEIHDIQVFLAAGSQSRWVTAVAGPRTFDLLLASDVQEVLGQAEAESGTYTRVRFELGSVTVVLQDESRQTVTPEQQALEVLRPFRVEEGKTTVILLDFDADRSLQPGPDGVFRFDTKVLVRVLKTAPPEGVAAGAPTDATAAPEQVSITGTVDSVTEDRIVVSGVEVSINPTQTTDIVPGATVTIDAQPGADGLLVGIDVQVTPAPPPTPEPQSVEVTGEIQSLAPGLLNVSGQEVVISASTEVSGVLALGATVSVSGARHEDGSILASRVQVLAGLPPAPAPEPAPPGSPE